MAIFDAHSLNMPYLCLATGVDGLAPLSCVSTEYVTASSNKFCLKPNHQVSLTLLLCRPLLVLLMLLAKPGRPPQSLPVVPARSPTALRPSPISPPDPPEGHLFGRLRPSIASHDDE